MTRTRAEYLSAPLVSVDHEPSVNSRRSWSADATARSIELWTALDRLPEKLRIAMVVAGTMSPVEPTTSPGEERGTLPQRPVARVLVAASEMRERQRLFSGEIVAPQPLPAAGDELSIPELAIDPIAPALAQEAKSPAKPTVTALRVEVAISRHLGEKRLTHTPYELSVTPENRSSLRIGGDVPVPTTTITRPAPEVQEHEYHGAARRSEP